MVVVMAGLLSGSCNYSRIRILISNFSSLYYGDDDDGACVCLCMCMCVKDRIRSWKLEQKSFLESFWGLASKKKNDLVKTPGRC